MFEYNINSCNNINNNIYIYILYYIYIYNCGKICYEKIYYGYIHFQVCGQKIF